MANALPPVPMKTPVLDVRGLLSREWAQFFNELVSRVGGVAGNSTTDLSNEITLLEESLADSVDDITQGRQL
jgi:hypothetical protein